MRPGVPSIPVLVIVLAAVAFAAGLFAQAGTVRLPVELPDNPMAGARVFVQKGCSRCHALGGDEVRVGPDLGRLHFPGSVLDLAAAFWNHSPVMREKMHDLKVQLPRLTSDEMADLVGFLTAYRYYLAQLGAPGDPAAGRAVFAQNGCARCHGATGDWTRRGPALERYRGRFSAIFLAQAMWNHGAEMAAAMEREKMPWPHFTGRQMADLLGYLQAGDDGSAERVYFEPGNPRRGRELFTSKRCDTCHAIAGTGGRGGPDLGTQGAELVASEAAMAGLMWNHSLGMRAEFRRRGITPVAFSGEEMADIIAYLYFVNYADVRGLPARGSRLFSDKCSACHTLGDGQRAAPDLATVPGLEDPIGIITAMWNHSPKMEQELRIRGLAWPRLQPGDAADLTAYLLSARAGRGGPSP
jgi:cytochrome c2